MEACGVALQYGAARLYSFFTPQKLIFMPIAAFSSGVAFQYFADKVVKCANSSGVGGQGLWPVAGLPAS